MEDPIFVGVLLPFFSTSNSFPNSMVVFCAIISFSWADLYPPNNKPCAFWSFVALGVHSAITEADADLGVMCAEAEYSSCSGELISEMEP